ncbi:MAG: PIG-L deacetylase family protein [Nanoarchaeota archaeon]|nr:PIG-L family deacetylase [Nanoarchaeota archaeon]MBU1876708.1 PIG-L family deacetylase [Nanoarchaeota archaeon]
MKKREQKSESILVFGAHSDDFVIGAGGTVAKYSKEGKNVIAIAFSFGEKSHAWLKESVVQKMRAEEAFEASDLLGCKVYFFDLREGHFIEDYKEKNIEQKILNLIKATKPNKIFTHSHEDPHPDHKASYQITMKLYDKIKYKKPEVFIYSVWNPVSFKTQHPALYVDISKTFFLKLKALKAFRSQKIHVAYPLLLLLFRAVIEGFKIRKKFAEKFFRIK